MTSIALSDHQLLTLLAALRLYQDNGYGDEALAAWCKPEILDIASDAGRLLPMANLEINALRLLLANSPSVPSDSSSTLPSSSLASCVSSFTTFCQESTGTGTIHICCVRAASAADAIEAGKRRCIHDWNAREEEDGIEWAPPHYDANNIHCLGVAAGDVQILDWQDICNL